MRRRLMPVLMLALITVAMFGGVAYGATVPTPPYESNDQCLECHDVVIGGAALSRVDFAVPAVDFAACSVCHDQWINPMTDHDHGGMRSATGVVQRCSACHNISSMTAPNYVPTVKTAYGWFATSSSLYSSAERMHQLHTTGSWVMTSIGGDPSLGCGNCHAPTACSACHTGAIAHGNHAVSQYPAVSYLQTTGGWPLTSETSCVNAACHPLSTIASTPVPTCSSCHSTKQVVHGYEAVDHVADDDTVDGMACSACHALDLATVHGDSGAAGLSCATCHPVPRDTFGAWDQSCATGGCHTSASTAPMHADIDASHAVSGSNSLCLDCHAGTELASIHVDAVSKATDKTSCFVCHTGAADEPETSDCTVCHFTFDDHYDEAAHASPAIGCSGAGCHDTGAGLMTVHEERNAAFGCWGCHNSVRADVQDAIVAGDTSCAACHGSISGLGGHRDAHNPTPQLIDAAGPQYSYYTGSVGTAPTGDCAGCHTSNLVDEHVGLYFGGWVVFPRYDGNGSALTCGTCHDQPAGSPIQVAIAEGKSACESCHPVHGPIGQLHTSTFVDSPEVPCADCHSADLAAEHDHPYVSAAGISGCGVCHNLYTGMTSGSVTGDTVQAAISTTNDTRCTACHASYHTNSTAHNASSAESLACGKCHAAGETVIDVTSVHSTCAMCHSSARIGAISEHTAECSSCHATEGTDYHAAMDTAHTYTAMDASCLGAGCHAAKTLPEEHERFLDRNPGYTSTCALCHENTDASRIDWASASASCDSCHTVHGDIDVIHTSEATEGCFGCHKTNDALALHIDEATGATDCAACHNTTTTLPRPLTCGACHATEGTDYHAAMGTAHTYTAMDASCLGAGCHAAKTLPEEHERFLARNPGYTSTCALCHENTDASRIDWASASASCDSCHTVHGAIDVIHTATKSKVCVDCHRTGDVLSLHVTKSTGKTNCALCHAAPAGRINWTTATAECASCHGSLQPVETKHYPTSAHASVMNKGCSNCHSMDLKAEHAKSTIKIGCVACHQKYVNSMARPWNKSCDACHPTRHKDRVGGAGGSGGGKGGKGR